MTKVLPLIAAVSFALAFAFSSGPEIAQAQTPRMDTIRLMAATRGANFDGSLKWCVSQTWHVGYRVGGIEGPATSLDEQPQTGGVCTALATEQVEFAAYGLTTDTTCTQPCLSLFVEIISGRTAGQCDLIEAHLFDYSSVNTNPTPANGYFRGRQRMLHTTGPSGPRFYVRVTSGTWYSGGDNWRTVGTVVNDFDCETTTGGPGFTRDRYHVHQDFMPPTTSEKCLWSKNTSTNFATNTTERRRDDPNIWYLYSIDHRPGVSCIVAGGQRASDFLLRPGGELDGPTPNSGQGARSLTTGATITTSSICYDETSWCGTMTVTSPVLRAAQSYDQGWPPVVYLKGQQQCLPPPGVDCYWYGPDAQGYVFWVRDAEYVYRDTIISCSGVVYAGERMYYLNFRSSANITCPNGQNWDGAGNPTTYRVVKRHVGYVWSQFRGINGINPSLPPTQEEANAWAQSWIDTGHWLNVVKPAMDAVIRVASSTTDMATLGITGNPPFDGNLGNVGLAEATNGPNTLASRITEPPPYSWAPDGMNRDSILSSRVRWKPTRRVLKITPR